MKTKKKQLFLAVLVIAIAAIMAPQGAMAAGTAACTSINNTATVDYKVGTVSQSQLTTGPTATFVVGNKVRPTVVTTDGSPRTVYQGETNRVMTFTVTNDGNKTQDYALTPYNNVGGTAFTTPAVTDTFDAGSPTVVVESGATAGYQAGEDIAAFIDNLASGATTTVYVIAAGPIPLVSNGSIAVYGLKAKTHRGDVSGGSIEAAVVNGETGACSEDTVFADIASTTGADDGDTDGADSDRSALVVSAGATLTVTKSSKVYSDPINNTTNPKSIPGAIVTYTVNVTNPGGSTATATSVSIVDSLNAQITAGTLAFTTQLLGTSAACGAGEGIAIGTTVDGTSGMLTDGVCKTNASSADDNVDFGVTTANTVTVTGLSIAPGASKIVQFQVTIQ